VNLTSKLSFKPDRAVLGKQCQNITSFRQGSLYEFMMCKLYIFIVFDTSRTCLVRKDKRSSQSADRCSVAWKNEFHTVKSKSCFKFSAALQMKQSKRNWTPSAKTKHNRKYSSQFLTFFHSRNEKCSRNVRLKQSNRSACSLGLSTNLGSSDGIKHRSF